MTKNKNKGNKSNGSGLASMVTFKGPITEQKPSDSIVRVLLKNKYNGGSNSAGFMELWNSTSQATTLPEWGTFAAVYREYRVLGIKWMYQPWYDAGGYIGSSNNLSVGTAAVYHGPPPSWQTAVTTTSDLNTWMMEGASPFHPGRPKTLEWRMNDVEEAQFVSTSTAVQSGGVYSIVPSLTASRQLGSVFVSFLIEFKGRV